MTGRRRRAPGSMGRLEEDGHRQVIQDQGYVPVVFFVSGCLDCQCAWLICAGGVNKE